MRFALGVLLLIICVISGYVLSDKFVKKRKFYNDFYQFNQKLKNETMFSMNSIKTIINGYEGDFYSNTSRFFQTRKFAFDKNYLSEQQLEEYKNYLNFIGQADKETQIKFLSEYELQIKTNLENATSDEGKYKKLYIKIAFLIGLMALIVVL